MRDKIRERIEKIIVDWYARIPKYRTKKHLAEIITKEVKKEIARFIATRPKVETETDVNMAEYLEMENRLAEKEKEIVLQYKSMVEHHEAETKDLRQALINKEKEIVELKEYCILLKQSLCGKKSTF